MIIIKNILIIKKPVNSKDIIYMDYSIDKVFNQYLNLSFTAQRYNEDNEKKDRKSVV